MISAWLSRLTAPRSVDIPAPLWADTLARLPGAAHLTAEQGERLRELTGQLLAAKQMEAAGGLELTPRIEVAIAAQACLPVLELGLAWYRGWTSIVVYPGEFLVHRQHADNDGVVHEFTEPLAGEAWDGGPVIVSWADAQRATGELGQSYAVVIHEFAHKLDLLNGEANGVPPFDRRLHPGLSPRLWQQALGEALDRFCAELDLIEAEIPADLDPESVAADAYYVHLPLDAYAAQDEAEFFAVSSEAFFIAPQRLQAAFPAWYELLARFYRQDPALS
ncbi:MAG: zinc-dependent peptidase [Burkholderiaceae bacterium]